MFQRGGRGREEVEEIGGGFGEEESFDEGFSGIRLALVNKGLKALYLIVPVVWFFCER